jgi:hypothetical protein
MQDGMAIPKPPSSPDDVENINNNFTKYCPPPPVLMNDKLMAKEFQVPDGNGIWNTYFEPVSDFVPGDPSCRNKPLIEIGFSNWVSTDLLDICPWTVKAWRYDNVPESLLQNTKNNDRNWMKEWLDPMRTRAHNIVQKYYQMKPFIVERAEHVNFIDRDKNETCLGVHIRLADKQGKHRRKVKAGEYKDYMEAFARAVASGGRTGFIYIATDSQRALKYMRKVFPAFVVRLFRTQGEYIVRSQTGDYPTHMLDDHHRVNSETLVDILALSKCDVLLHGYSTVSEAVMYLNPGLHNHSVNLEEDFSHRLSPKAFEMMIRFAIGIDNHLQKEVDDSKKYLVQTTNFVEPRVLVRHGSDQGCQSNNSNNKNAIVYLVQKVHSSYNRDSYGTLLRSLQLLHEHYLSVDNHMDNTNLFLFHTGDFNATDVEWIEDNIFHTRGFVRLVDLSGSRFWARPESNRNDIPEIHWYVYPRFSEGYRRMIHWYAIDIWDFFAWYNERHENCQYQYLFRLDEDSYLHSAISYDVFDFMKNNGYVYGFRMCSYELMYTQRMSRLWNKSRAATSSNFVPRRALDLEMCGFYNNFFMADMAFFRSAPVQRFLRFIDREGHIYRRRFGDLMIHSMAIYWFADPSQIHRFLDFSYEHSTYNVTTGCLVWGGLQVGYDDPNPTGTLQTFQNDLITRGCGHGNVTYLTEDDLSPTYSHLPRSRREEGFCLPTVTAGEVELPGKGLLSG